MNLTKSVCITRNALSALTFFNGRILEIEGLSNLKLEQAFELTDASAERSCAGCTIQLSKSTIAEYLNSNVALLKNMIARGYQDSRTIKRRIKSMQELFLQYFI